MLKSIAMACDWPPNMAANRPHFRMTDARSSLYFEISELNTYKTGDGMEDSSSQ